MDFPDDWTKRPLQRHVLQQSGTRPGKDRNHAVAIGQLGNWQVDKKNGSPNICPVHRVEKEQGDNRPAARNETWTAKKRRSSSTSSSQRCWVGSQHLLFMMNSET
ncbi:hypothetical protein EMPG_12227 [Blastomyces silverae]|uniref:Uncharacterized protein n=1 Tax=Blastomyces silverae TaxID=2060906 RepID=A0A0H1BP15_9EURO|nr:hypothetical protein EMPG_12227 [Blastomyces silverae]